MLPIKITLPDGFLETEVRCGYTVSAEMKKVWAVELDLLAEFDRVCKKNNVKYFLDGGSLLGAVRHKGFIPWDDDVDISMLRKDYIKLSQIAEQEFKYPYFFQTPFSDPGLAMGGSRLRNSATTLVSDFENKRPYKNKGIFIDIFVYDNIPDNDIMLKKYKLVLKYYWRILRYASYYENYFKPNTRYSAKRLLAGKFALFLKRIFGIETLSRGYENYCSRMLGKKTKRLGYSRGKRIFPCDCFDEIMTAPFENIQVPIPKEYDKVLTTKYGNYMVMVQQPSTHRPLVFDAETPYSEYKLNSIKVPQG